MFVHAEQQVGTQKHAMLIPDTAISADIKGYYVYRDINNRAIKTYIQTGTHLKDLVEVTKGLTAKDIIVSSGIQKLEDGSIITVLQPKKPTSSNTKTGA